VTAERLLEDLRRFETALTAVEARFVHRPNAINIAREDDGPFRQMVHELIDLFTDSLGKERYANEIRVTYNEGISNYLGSPSLHSVQEIARIVRSAIVRVERKPELLDAVQTQGVIASPPDPKKVFIIHGHDEAKRRELEALLASQFGLIPIVLADQPNAGANTIIEKFEYYAPMCAFAFALFTPDDQVTVGARTILQARPNVIYELGWFAGARSRRHVMLLLKEGTEVFSDLGGIIQHRFRSDVSERLLDIQRDLRDAGLVN
jgi:predicted nucleotide-binding protein